MKEFYVYIYLDASKPGIYTYGEYSFDYEPIYIGKGKNYRFTAHLGDCRNQKLCKKIPYFYNKLRKLLEERKVPIIRILEKDLSGEEALLLEVKTIKEIGKRVALKGPLYNISDGGEGNSGWKKKTFKIRSYNRKGEYLKTYENITEVTLDTGIKDKQLYKFLSGYRNGKNSILRFRRDSENIDKLEDLSNIVGNRSIKIYQYNITGNFIKEWESSRKAAKELGISDGAICEVLCGRKKSVRNLIFKRNKT